MTLKFKDDGGVDRTITAIYFKDGGGVDRTIDKIKFNTKIIFSTTPDITVMLSNDFAGGNANNTGNATSFTSITATPTGGTAPYTYAWTLEDIVGSGTAVVDSPTSATTYFSITGIPSEEFYSATARCTVRDANLFPASATCFVSFYGGF